MDVFLGDTQFSKPDCCEGTSGNIYRAGKGAEPQLIAQSKGIQQTTRLHWQMLPNI